MKPVIETGDGQSSYLMASLYLALMYAATGWFSHVFVPETGFASIIWAPAGIALGGLLAWGRRLWPGVLFGAALINAYFLSGNLPLTQAVLAATLMGWGATLQAVLGESSFRQFYLGLLKDQVTAGTLFRYFRTVLAVSVVSPLVGTAILLLWRQQMPAEVASVFVAWWLGDSLGVVLLTPVVLAFCGQPREQWQKRRAMLALPLLSAFVLLSIAFFVVGYYHREQREADFERNVERLSGRLQQAVREAENLSSTFAHTVAVAGGLSSSGIERFMQNQPVQAKALQGLVWIPHTVVNAMVRGDQRDLSMGHSAMSWRVNFAKDGALFSPSGLLQYLNQTSLLQVALNSPRVIVSGVSQLPWLPVSSGQPVFLVVAPVKGDADKGREGAFNGWAVAFFDAESLFDVAAADLEAKISWRLSAPDIVGLSEGFVRHGPVRSGSFFRHVVDFSFGGQNLRLQVFELPQKTVYFHQSNIWLVYFGGLLFSIFLCYFLLRMASFAAQSERLVEARNQELELSRQEAEKAIKLLREAVDSIEQGFTIYDENDRLVICNEAYLSLYETSRDLIVPGSSFEEIVRKGAERGQYSAAIGRVDEWVAERVAQHQKADGSVLEQNLGDGRWLMIVEYRTPSGFIAGNRIDISRIKQAALIIEDRNAQLDTLFSLSPDGFVAFGSNGLMKFANPAFYHMTGLSGEAILGQDLACLDEQLMALQDASEPPVSILLPGERGDLLPNCTVKLVKPETRILQVVSMHSDAASISRILYVRDITLQTEINRMKSEFLAHAAHELRTPMTSILGFTELLLMRQLDVDKQKDILQTVHRQTRWLVDIINELLDLARIEARRGKDFKRVETDVAGLVRSVLRMQSFDPAKWPVTLNLPDTPLMACIDVAKFQQALTNVLGNAQKYSPQGGPIRVDVFRNEQMIVIEIQDAGIGMAEEELLHFGERFWRADRSGQLPGTGLGISIVKEIVELHGGHVSVFSRPGEGTRVMLSLPLVAV